MGKDKQPVDVETPFVPKISEVSRKIALRKTELVDTKGLPHFMLHTKCKPARELLDPIFPSATKRSLELFDPVSAIALNAPKSRRNIEISDDRENARLKLKNIDGLTAMSKNDLISTPVVLDENVFTFHPKVSDTSNRIVENLGTDFMARQQKHLEKQRRLADEGCLIQEGIPANKSKICNTEFTELTKEICQLTETAQEFRNPEQLNQATAKQNCQALFVDPLSPIHRSFPSRRLSDRLELAQPVRPVDFPSVHKRRIPLSSGPRLRSDCEKKKQEKPVRSPRKEVLRENSMGSGKDQHATSVERQLLHCYSRAGNLHKTNIMSTGPSVDKTPVKTDTKLGTLLSKKAHMSQQSVVKSLPSVAKRNEQTSLNSEISGGVCTPRKEVKPSPTPVLSKIDTEATKHSQTEQPKTIYLKNKLMTPNSSSLGRLRPSLPVLSKPTLQKIPVFATEKTYQKDYLDISTASVLKQRVFDRHILDVPKNTGSNQRPLSVTDLKKPEKSLTIAGKGLTSCQVRESSRRIPQISKPDKTTAKETSQEKSSVDAELKKDASLSAILRSLERSDCEKKKQEKPVRSPRKEVLRENSGNNGIKDKTPVKTDTKLGTLLSKKAHMSQQSVVKSLPSVAKRNEQTSLNSEISGGVCTPRKEVKPSPTPVLSKIDTEATKHSQTEQPKTIYLKNKLMSPNSASLGRLKSCFYALTKPVLQKVSMQMQKDFEKVMSDLPEGFRRNQSSLSMTGSKIQKRPWNLSSAGERLRAHQKRIPQVLEPVKDTAGNKSQVESHVDAELREDGCPSTSSKNLEESGTGPLTLPGAVEEESLAQEPDEGSDEVSSTQTTSISRSQNPAQASLSQAASNQENQKRQRNRAFKDNVSKSAAETMDVLEDKENDVLGSFVHMRSKTMPSLGRPKIQRKLSTINDGDRLRMAKEQVEKAIKYKKVFTIQGGYSTIRHLLRKRGWVEKFYRIQPPPKPTPRTKRRKNSDDDDDSDGADDVDDDDDDDADVDDSKDDQPKVPPWEEEDGVYGIMSRMVRNVNPTFIWVLRRDTIDYRYLSKDQIINHYCRAGSFTTKVGLCVNMRNVPWFESADPDTFYPRCYRLSHEEDRSAFIDDFRLTACMSVLKLAVAQMKEVHMQLKREAEQAAEQVEAEGACTNPTCTRSRPNSKTGNKCVHASTDQEEALSDPAKSASATEMTAAADSAPSDAKEDEAVAEPAPAEEIKPASSGRSKGKKKVGVALRVVEFAVTQCERFLRFRNHEDIDVQEQINEPNDEAWEKFLQQYYILSHEGGYVPYVPRDLLTQCETLLNRLKSRWPQFDLDGTRNVWIVKPGAKSRGRGIICYDKLEEMLKLVSAQVVQKEGKYVVQKYMERPLLIYNTKFDIRQWFLVTDWNPLTLWFYQDSYLRFCSQEYTLDNFDESIHLSNNAIQKHYKNGPRSDRLPAENMWTHVQFQDYLTSRKLGNLWDEVIYPGMKKAVICSLLATQDVIEYRKSSFELYGADFMLTEDFMPWMIEINSSPSMESSTAITARLCSAVLEDTLKVVLDRRYDRNCDVGRFELAFKQPLVTVPPYIGISLSIDGQSLRKPAMTRGAQDTTPRTLPKPSTSLDRMIDSKKCGGGSNGGSASLSANSGGKENHTARRSSKTPDSKVRFAMYTSKGSTDGRTEADGKGANEQGNLRSGGDGQSQAVNHHRSGEAPNLHPIRSHSPREDRKSQGLSSASRSADGQDGAFGRDPDHLTRPSDGGARLRVPAPPPPKTLTTTPGTALQQVAARRIVSRTSVSSNYPAPPSIPDKNTKAPTMSVNNVESTDLQTIKPSKGFLNPLIAGAWGRTCGECGSGMNLHLSKLNPKCKCQRDSVIVRFDNARIKSATAGYVSKSKNCQVQRSPSAGHGDGSSPGRGMRRSSAQCSMSKSSSKTFLNYTDGGIPRPSPTSRNHQMIIPHNPRLVQSFGTPRVVNFKYSPHLPQFMNNSVYLDTSQLKNPLSIVSQTFR